MAWIRRFLLVGIGLSCLPDVEIPTVLAPKTCGDGIVQISLDEQCDPGDAGAIGCTSDCRIDCDGGVADPWRHHCYFNLATKTDVPTARQACGASNAHLVTFGSSDELGFVTFNVLDAATAWIDLQRDNAGHYATGNSETGFSAMCPGCYAQPTNGNFVAGDAGGGPCLLFTRDFESAWITFPCSKPFIAPVICEREAPGRALAPCDAGTCIEIAATALKSTYVLGPPKSFADARSTCQTMGGDLAILETAEEREDLARAIAGATGDAWVGLTGTGGTWTWVDGTAILTSPWAEGEPAAGSTAYLSIDPSYDTRLVHVDTGAGTHAMLCEIKSR